VHRAALNGDVGIAARRSEVSCREQIGNLQRAAEFD
jgi:hypothetical protein